MCSIHPDRTNGEPEWTKESRSWRILREKKWWVVIFITINRNVFITDDDNVEASNSVEDHEIVEEFKM